MKTIRATEARSRFGELLEEAGAGSVIIQKNGRDDAGRMAAYALVHSLVYKAAQTEASYEWNFLPTASAL